MPQKLKILILNWRDIKNPTSGGAEILTHEVARRWAKKGHIVTQFSSYFPNAKKNEVIDGVNFVREGKSDIRYIFNSVHFAGLKYYWQNKEKFDVVVDEIHGIPFFTPLYVGKKKVALICEVAGRIWDTNFPLPFNLIGKFAEKVYFNFYKNIHFLTISNSTKDELEKFGVKKTNITVLPMGVSSPRILPSLSKEKDTTMIFVARLVKTKGIEDALKALKVLRAKFPSSKLWIVGRGDTEYESKLKKMVRDMSLGKNVRFYGFVNQYEKFKLMQRAHILIVPSIKEGFGLTVPEAGLVGTPAVAYNVEGLRDIINGNGMLVNPNFKDLARGVERLIDDKDYYEKVRENAITSAKKMNWDNTARVGLKFLEI